LSVLQSCLFQSRLCDGAMTISWKIYFNMADIFFMSYHTSRYTDNIIWVCQVLVQWESFIFCRCLWNTLLRRSVVFPWKKRLSKTFKIFSSNQFYYSFVYGIINEKHLKSATKSWSWASSNAPFGLLRFPCSEKFLRRNFGKISPE